MRDYNNSKHSRSKTNRYRKLRDENNPFTPSYKESLKYRKRKASGLKKLFSLLFFTIVILVSAFVLFTLNPDILKSALGENNPVSAFLEKLSLENSSKIKPEFGLPFGPRRHNILLLGVDSNGPGSDLWDGTRTDTIILLNIDPKNKTVNAISIPRDSKVYLPKGHGIEKINAAHSIGGIHMTLKTVEDTLGVKVDKYIMFHDEGVRELVKTLGGVDIYVEKNMHYNDYAGNLHINFTKGYHHLTENDVVEYLRFRHDATGDLGRTKRQQWFLRGLLSSLQKPDAITKFPQLVSVASKYVKTNMSPFEMTQYLSLARSFDMDNIEIAMLPGAPNKHGVISYWILDPERTQDVVDRLIYRKKPSELKESYTASIISTSAKRSESDELKKLLEANGISVICTDVINQTHSQFIAHSNYVTVDYYVDLKRRIPNVKSRQFVYEPGSFMCANTDFTIVLADNDNN